LRAIAVMFLRVNMLFLQAAGGRNETRKAPGSVPSGKAAKEVRLCPL
jgi:hypothetical protein